MGYCQSRSPGMRPKCLCQTKIVNFLLDFGCWSLRVFGASGCDRQVHQIWCWSLILLFFDNLPQPKILCSVLGPWNLFAHPVVDQIFAFKHLNYYFCYLSNCYCYAHDYFCALFATIFYLSNSFDTIFLSWLIFFFKYISKKRFLILNFFFSFYDFTYIHANWEAAKLILLQ